MFGADAERLDAHLTIGNIYTIQNGRVQLANKKFLEGIRNDYEIAFNDKTTVTMAEDDDTIPEEKYYFLQITTIFTTSADQVVDVIGLATSIDDVVTVTTKTDKKLLKRELILWDTSEKSICLTLWGAFATQVDKTEHLGQALAVKNARVSDYHGKTLNTTATSTISFNPDFAEAKELVALKLKK